MQQILNTIILLLLMGGHFFTANAQTSIEVVDISATHAFGSQITFSARIISPSPIQEATLSFQIAGEMIERKFPLTPDENGFITYQYSVQEGLLRPFSKIFFSFQVIVESGEVFTTQEYEIEYDDNRFPWQTLDDGRVRIHWYSGDTDFGQSATVSATEGLRRIDDLIPAMQQDIIDIYIYASPADVQNVLDLGGLDWLAGIASPDIGVILLSIMPGENHLVQMDNQIPRELARMMLYQYTGRGYEFIPFWLREGFIEQAMVNPNPDYDRVLEVALQAQTLIPISELCADFPQDPSNAFLAHAESASIVNFLLESYGSQALEVLIRTYAEGLNCDLGVSQALNISLSSLEQQWRENKLGEASRTAAAQNLLPYVIVLFIIITVPVLGIILNRTTDQGKENV